MALINCPECGRENVSSSATVCPSCGYPVKQHHEKGEETNPKTQQRVVYYDILLGEDESIFDSGLSDGTNGKCIEKTGMYDYSVINDTLYITRNVGTVTYTIAGDYLLNNKAKYKGMIPDGASINTSCTRPNFMGGEDVKTFFWNGKYSEISFGTASSGSYVRKDDLVAISADSTGNKPNCFLIYNNTLYYASCIKKERVSAVKNLIANFVTTSNCSTQSMPSYVNASQTAIPNSATNASNINWGKIVGIVVAIIIVILLLKNCGGSSYDSNDDKCDICGKSAYTKLSDGNEYCYDHYKNAIDYYLDD